MRIPKNKPIIGYKAFTKALQCRGYQFAIGKEYHHKGPIQLCTQGFHFCSSVAEVQRVPHVFHMLTSTQRTPWRVSAIEQESELLGHLNG